MYRFEHLPKLSMYRFNLHSDVKFPAHVKGTDQGIRGTVLDFVVTTIRKLNSFSQTYFVLKIRLSLE